MKKIILLFAAFLALNTINAQTNTYEENLRNYVDNTMGVRSNNLQEFESLESQVPEQYRSEFKRRYTELVNQYSDEVFAVYNEFYGHDIDVVNSTVLNNTSAGTSNQLPVLSSNAVMQTYLSKFQQVFNETKQALFSKYLN